VILGSDRRGEVAFSVSNVSGRALRGRSRLVFDPGGGEAAVDLSGWLTVVPPEERDFDIAETEQYRVQIAPPENAPAESYSFQLDMMDVENPEEHYSPGPTVTFRVPEMEEAPRKFPWWIVAVVAGVLVVSGVVVFLLLRSVEQRRAAQATATAQAAMTRAALHATATAQAQATGIAQATETAQAVASRTAVARITATAQAQATANAIANATATASANATAVAQAINRYTGTWEGDDSNSPYMTKLRLNRDGEIVQVFITGRARLVASGSGLASEMCTTLADDQECTWGQAMVSYSGDPMSFEVETQPGLVHRITFTVTQDGNTLSAVDQVFWNNNRQFTNNYLFEPAPFDLTDIRIITDLPVLTRPDLLVTVFPTRSP
jgi:hypothetical protein